MKHIVLGFVLLASGLGVGLALRKQQVTAQEKDVTTNPVGTFQLVASGNDLNMLNTRTGEAWQYNGRQWFKLPGIGPAVPLKAADVSQTAVWIRQEKLAYERELIRALERFGENSNQVRNIKASIELLDQKLREEQR